jgi:hypothetical protein
MDILLNLRRAASGGHSVFIAEHVVPSPDVPQLSKLFDIHMMRWHMMCWHMMRWGTGQERTKDQYVGLLEAPAIDLAGSTSRPIG